MSSQDQNHLVAVQQLPVAVRDSQIISAENLQKLAGVAAVPDVDPSFADDTLKNIFQYYSIDPEEMEKEIHIYANTLLDKNEVGAAWQVLLAVS